MLRITPISPSALGYYFDGRDPGRWVGPAVERLDLAPAPGRPELDAVLRGRHPRSGAFLPAVKPARRRAGWDLTFACPKSVSLLAALAPDARDAIGQAHRAATDGALGHLARELIEAETVGAAFDHTTNAGAEPHLHSHVILANLGFRPGAGWGTVSHGWWPSRIALGAIYQLGLRHHLAATGLELEWRLRGDGLADLVDVPRAAIRATSSRSREALDDHGTFASRRSARPRPWQARAAAAGFASADAATLGRSREPGSLAATRPPDGPVSGRLAAAVTDRLAGIRSTFRRADVLAALGACSATGMSAPAAEAWTSTFCSTAIPVVDPPSGSPRWATTRARELDRRLVDIAGSAAGLSILRTVPGRTSLLAHAARIEALSAAWGQAGEAATVATGTPGAAARWRALTALGPYHPGQRGGVVVVDQADRRPTPDLLALIAQARDAGNRIVLVEGGTLPGLTWRASHGFEQLADAIGVEAGPLPRWEPFAQTGPASHRAAGWLLAEWVGPPTGRRPRAERSVPSGRAGRPLLLGLGPAETGGLNRAARDWLLSTGELAGPAAVVGGREMCVGEQVVALRRLGTDVPAGTRGRVESVAPAAAAITVRWPTGIERIAGRAGHQVGYGYAVTPPLAARMAGPLLVLGQPADVPRLHRRVIGASDVGPIVDRGRQPERGQAERGPVVDLGR